ncbi:SDR family NAD(P)-dependent oxidoreductase [Geomicrobium sp. JCM 19039]|uniref:SDR family NAD(P)-dependent oxidoreductase n=1 Tax=Geomicrobium sp. JCM 19039 TaxID=1460636 RepID=UPI00045F1954|nr:glucose 1-dehydrogenase [Geomicrobium sp. JCM 19039]GAK12377.1 3-oxoacyl-[acyl-carrier protein] reductase [Geomicrobium sp. JCM 19039]
MNASELFSVKNCVIVLTGASQGIGKSLAELYVTNGAKVALVARNRSSLEAVQEELGNGENVAIFPFDVTETAQLPKLAEDVFERFGAIDVLVNNAGTNITKPAIEFTEAEWDAVLDLNLKSAFFFSQAVYPYMKKQGGGKIIHMSSQMAEVGYYKRSAYSSSKGGVKQLTKALAIEWAGDHILVNAVGPTFIETPLTATMMEDDAFKADVLSRIPLGRLAKTEDLFGAMLYLSSGASNMVTGQTLYVDGGWTSW